MTGYEAEVRRYVQMVTSCHICRVIVVLCCGLVWSSCCGVFIWRWSVSVSYTQAPCRQANKKSSQEEQHKAKRFAHTHTHTHKEQQKQQQQENSGKKSRAARLPNEQKDQHTFPPCCIISAGRKAQIEGTTVLSIASAPNYSTVGSMTFYYP